MLRGSSTTNNHVDSRVCVFVCVCVSEEYDTPILCIGVGGGRVRIERSKEVTLWSGKLGSRSRYGFMARWKQGAHHTYKHTHETKRI